MPEVRIRLAIGSLRVEYSGTRAFFERTIEPLVQAAYARDGSEEAPPGQMAGPAGSGQAADDGPALPAGPIFQPSSQQRFVQYAGQVGENAATVNQRIMAFSFYLWNYERREEFPVDEIGAFFRTVHETPPPDLGARIEDLAEQKRFLEPGRDEGAWRLTSKGVNYVKNRLLGAGL